MKNASLVGSVLLGLVVLCLAPCVPHDLQLVRMRRQYRELSHPPASRALAYESGLGLLYGNGNHCDYFVGELRVSTLSYDELSKHYAGAADVEEVFPWEVVKRVSTPDERLRARANGQALAPEERLYLVSVSAKDAPGADPRCH